MPASQIACQLYTLREFSKTPADIAATLKKVKKIGYDAVQVSGIGKIDPKELANILKGEGLACCVTHISKDRMRDETQAVIDEHKMWGCKYTAIGGFFPKENVSTQTWTDFAGEYNQIAKKLAGGGLKIGYHNHSHELAHFDGKPAMQILIDRLDPSVWIEIDTYWIQHGGGDPAAWIRRMKQRSPLVHLKDMAVVEGKPVMAEVGEGNLNWPAILEACREAGVRWYLVEQDVCRRDPFESLGISLRNLKAMGIE